MFLRLLIGEECFDQRDYLGKLVLFFEKLGTVRQSVFLGSIERIWVWISVAYHQ